MSTTGILTEREWRKKASRAPSRNSCCWGAQCMLARQRRKTLAQDRAFQLFLVLLSFAIALFLPVLVPRAQAPEMYQQAPEEAHVAATAVRSVSAIGYTLPFELEYRSQTYTHEQLLRGKLLLVNASQSLPAGVPAPNTLSIASYGKGMVPVNDLSIKSGRETIDALARLFSVLRGRGVGGLAVWRATLSPAEQREQQLAQLRAYAEQMPINDAVIRTYAEMDEPRTGDLQQEYTVEIRLSASGSAVPDERPLGQTAQGRFLLQTAWRHGFIQRSPTAAGARSFRFRYVGEAHATAMTYLDLGFEDYLELLHQKGQLTVKKDGKMRYIIICKPIDEMHIEFSLPKAATYEYSLDNSGYAVVACTLTK